MSGFGILVLLCLIFSLPFIFRNPFIGLLLVLAVQPISPIIALPAGLTAGRIAGAFTIASWVAYISTNVDSAQRFQQSQMKWWIFLFPLTCLLGTSIGLLENGWVNGVGKTLNVFLLASMALIIENQVTTPKRFSTLIAIVVVSSLIAVLFPLAFHFGIDLYTPIGADLELVLMGAEGRAAGLAGNTNGLGIGAAMGIFGIIIAIAGSRDLKPLLLLAFAGAACLGGLLLSGSRTNVIAVFVCLVVYFAGTVMGTPRNRIIGTVGLFLLLSAVPLVWLITPEGIQGRLNMVGSNVDSNTNERLDFTSQQRANAIRGLEQRPIFGAGLVNFQNAGLDSQNAHDTVSILIGETGLSGIVAFLTTAFLGYLGLIQILKTALAINDERVFGLAIGLLASFTGVLVAGLGGYIVFYERWFWLVLGMTPTLWFFLGREQERFYEYYTIPDDDF